MREVYLPPLDEPKFPNVILDEPTVTEENLLAQDAITFDMLADAIEESKESSR